MNWLVWAQAGSFVALGMIFILDGEVRLGVAQLLLAAVQAVIYTGRGLG